MLHDGVIHRFSHGQQASLSVTHIEALHRAEEFTANQEPDRNSCLHVSVESESPSFHRPGCVAPEAQV